MVWLAAVEQVEQEAQRVLLALLAEQAALDFILAAVAEQVGVETLKAAEQLAAAAVE
jgi:hypothetical protein